MPATRRNTTCDIYRFGNAPPAAPDVAGVPCSLFPRITDVPFSKFTAGKAWTHTLLLPFETDIRDGYDGLQFQAGTEDVAYIPDKNGTPFGVRFVDVIGRGTSNKEKRAMVDRRPPPSWPTNEL